MCLEYVHDFEIIPAHTNPYLFFPLNNCTYYSRIINNENLLAYVMHILKSCVVYKFQTVHPGCPPSQSHTFWSTAIRRDIRAGLCFRSCELRWHSTECVLLPCFNTLPDTFAAMKCSVLGDRWWFMFITVTHCSQQQRIKRVRVE